MVSITLFNSHNPNKSPNNPYIALIAIHSQIPNYSKKNLFRKLAEPKLHPGCLFKNFSKGMGNDFRFGV